MALSTRIDVHSRWSLGKGSLVYPAGVKDLWRWCHNAPGTADNSGNEVVAPLALTTSAIRRISPSGFSTVKFCLRYDDGATPNIDPVIQVFGIAENRDTQGAVPYRLVDADGNHAVTLVTAATDVTDGTYFYSDWVEFDLGSAAEILVAIKTAFTVSVGSVTGSQVLCQFS